MSDQIRYVSAWVPVPQAMLDDTFPLVEYLASTLALTPEERAARAAWVRPLPRIRFRRAPRWPRVR